MNKHTATEIAYKNGYAQGKADAAKKIEDLEGDLEVWKQKRFNIFQTTECYERARRQAAGEIFEEIEREYQFYRDAFRWSSVTDSALKQLYESISKIKKKYTEGVHEK